MADYGLLLSPSGAVIRYAGGTIRIRLSGARRHVEMDGLEPLPGKVNYIIGRHPARWLSGIPIYSKVRYRSVYPGVDLIFHGSRGEMEFDFILAPGADPSTIRLHFEGASQMKVEETGDLVFGEHRLRLWKPVMYQEHAAGRRLIPGGYLLRGRGKVGFRVSGYETAEPLVIDPVLSFSTYLGGSGQENGTAGSDMKGAGIATDPEGNVYITGTTVSADFSAGNKLVPPWADSADLFVAKFNPAGELMYSTRIGGSGLERGFGIAVDSSGSAYVTGRTQSTDFPIMNAVQPGFGGKEDAYVLKLNPAGTEVVYSTYLGGSDTDFACGIAIDAAGNAYVTGDTVSYNFPTTRAGVRPQYAAGASDAFIVKLGPAGSTLGYATYLGGSGFDHGESIAVDGNGNAYITGYTSSQDFPVARPFQPTFKGIVDAFVTKLNETGSALIYSTYLGGTNIDGATFLAVDSDGSAYITGSTVSTDFPTTPGVVQTAFKGEQDAFLSKLNPEGSAMVFSLLLGGERADGANGVAVDAAGNSYVVGSTRSPDFPVANAFQPAHAGFDEVFVSKLNATGSQLIHSSFLGGSGWELGYAIALDKSGNIYVTGRTTSTNFPTLKASQSSNNGGQDAFLVKIVDDSAVLTPFVTVSAASFEKGAVLAPDSIASGFGEKLAADIDQATSLPLPAVLGGVSVKVSDSAGTERAAPLFFVSPGQINYLIPEGTRPGPAVVTVLNQDKVVAAGTAGIERVAPALFSKNGDGKGVAAALAVKIDADGKQTVLPVFTCGTAPSSCVTTPIDLGGPNEQVILLLYGTGVRGHIGLDKVKANIGGLDGEVLYAGPQSEYPGLDQVNVKMPRPSSVGGIKAVRLTVEGKVTNAVEIRTN